MVDAFQANGKFLFSELLCLIFFFLQVGKRGDVLSEDGYTTATQMLGNCFQIPSSHTACFQRELGTEIPRFNTTWYSNQVSNGRQ